MSIFKCPSNKKEKEKRISEIYNSFECWIKNPKIRELVELTGGDFVETTNFSELFEFIFNYSRKWDFRSNNGNSQERWNIKDFGVYVEREDDIKKIAKELGYMDNPLFETTPTVIVPVGGARLSNLTRCEKAHEIYEKSSKIRAVVALSGLREINEIEIPYIETYSPGANNEFEAISSAMEKVFGLSEIEFEESEMFTNSNLSWVRRKYKDKEGVEFYSYAAPSLDGSRRANSYDSFLFLLKNFELSEDDNIAIVTSSIYAPFQYIRFLPIALESNLNVEFIGGANGAFTNASNYCQEIKATFDAMKDFMLKYPKPE